MPGSVLSVVCAAARAMRTVRRRGSVPCSTGAPGEDRTQRAMTSVLPGQVPLLWWPWLRPPAAEMFLPGSLPSPAETLQRHSTG